LCMQRIAAFTGWPDQFELSMHIHSRYNRPTEIQWMDSLGINS
jgi:hypothetical protein